MKMTFWLRPVAVSEKRDGTYRVAAEVTCEGFMEGTVVRLPIKQEDCSRWAEFIGREMVMTVGEKWK